MHAFRMYNCWMLQLVVYIVTTRLSLLMEEAMEVGNLKDHNSKELRNKHK
jgi:hypothetical protein